MTRKQLSFFNKPRTMVEIMNDLFNGDMWAANSFQNEEMTNGNLEICLIDNPLGNKYAKIIAIKKTEKAST